MVVFLRINNVEKFCACCHDICVDILTIVSEKL